MLSTPKLRRIARSVALAAAAFAGGALTSQHFASATPASQSPYLPFDQMARALVLVENNYVDPAQRERLVDGAIKGMVSELDPHSNYMNPAEYAQFRSDAEGKFGGIGVEVDFRDDFVTVIAPIEGSPAARAGIKSGDRILSIDGKPLRGQRVDRIIGLMRGEPGTKLRLGVAREGAEEPLYFDLEREIVHVDSVSSKLLDGGVLYLRLKQFQETTHLELLRAVGDARRASKQPLRGVLLDMRYNPGGLVDQSELVADEFLTQGSIYSTRHRGRVLDLVEARPGGALVDLPVAIVVNEYTASAAELVAGALQDHGRAFVVGAKTFGKGSVQTIFELPAGSGLKLTTMRYYTPLGRPIQAYGVIPDVLIRRAKATEIVREADLDGHLGAETERKQSTPREVIDAPADAAETPPLRIDEMPSDPRTSKDFAMAEAYRRLLARARP
jgi:carboxyl-terminal processing protease